MSGAAARNGGSRVLDRAQQKNSGAMDTSPSELPQWHALEECRRSFASRTLASLFKVEPDRARRWSFSAPSIHADLSRNWIDETTFAALFALARARNLEKMRAALLNGEAVNTTEHRPAWHTALRTAPDDPSLARSLDEEQMRFLGFAEALRTGRIVGSTGAPIDTVVCIGIGGSDLGPRLVTEALGPASGPVRVRFVSNIDPAELDAALDGARPEATVVAAISKSFTTLETLENLRVARLWLNHAGARPMDPAHHLIAVTAQPERAAATGVHPKRIFSFPDWVGGRYSLWSACGLPIAIAHGHQSFLDLRAGAAQMDAHFATTPLERNLPVILGLLGIWYVNFWNVRARAVFPYAQRLRNLPPYLQQLEMESLGKRVDLDGHALAADTAPIVWGEVGTTAQHSVFQFLHQGTHWTPADFLVVEPFAHSEERRHRLLHAAALAQADALAWGDSVLGAQRSTAPYAVAPGGRPSNILRLAQLDARSVGSLLALYEHRTFVQSVIWNINAFDQWGVEVGKKLLQQRLDRQGSLGSPS
jgi:glucose-6-phosphate isomerase